MMDTNSNESWYVGEFKRANAAAHRLGMENDALKSALGNIQSEVAERLLELEVGSWGDGGKEGDLLLAIMDIAQSAMEKQETRL